MEETKARAGDALYWPNMDEAILEKTIADCTTCNMYRQAQQKEALTPPPIPQCPWQKLGADVMSL